MEGKIYQRNNTSKILRTEEHRFLDEKPHLSTQCYEWKKTHTKAHRCGKNPVQTRSKAWRHKEKKKP